MSSPKQKVASSTNLFVLLHAFCVKEKRNTSGKDLTWSRQLDGYVGNQSTQGVRLWYLPGIAEVPLELTPEPREARFGIDIKRTDEVVVIAFSFPKT